MKNKDAISIEEAIAAIRKLSEAMMKSQYSAEKAGAALQKLCKIANEVNGELGTDKRTRTSIKNSSAEIPK